MPSTRKGFWHSGKLPIANCETAGAPLDPFAILQSALRWWAANNGTSGPLTHRLIPQQVSHGRGPLMPRPQALSATGSDTF